MAPLSSAQLRHPAGKSPLTVPLYVQAECANEKTGQQTASQSCASRISVAMACTAASVAALMDEARRSLRSQALKRKADALPSLGDNIMEYSTTPKPDLRQDDTETMKQSKGQLQNWPPVVVCASFVEAA